jgi:hypothetical protein
MSPALKFLLALLVGAAIGVGIAAAIETPRVRHAESALAQSEHAKDLARDTIGDLQKVIADLRAHQAQKSVDASGHVSDLDEYMKKSGGHLMNEQQCRAWMATMQPR